MTNIAMENHHFFRTKNGVEWSRIVIIMTIVLMILIIIIMIIMMTIILDNK